MTGLPPDFTFIPNLSIPDNNEDLNNEITRLAGHINAAQYRFLKLLAALIERYAWNGHGIKSPAHWLNYYCGISLGPAREKVRVAQCLQSLPLIDAAFARGEISYSKVRAMTRSATPENEHYLLEIAKFGTASHVEQLVRKHQAVKRQETDEQDKSREFSYYIDDDGMLVFKGRLLPEDGAVFIQAMQAMMDKLTTENVSACMDSSPFASTLFRRMIDCSRVSGLYIVPFLATDLDGLFAHWLPNGNACSRHVAESGFCQRRFDLFAFKQSTSQSN